MFRVTTRHGLYPCWKHRAIFPEDSHFNIRRHCSVLLGPRENLHHSLPNFNSGDLAHHGLFLICQYGIGSNYVRLKWRILPTLLVTPTLFQPLNTFNTSTNLYSLPEICKTFACELFLIQAHLQTQADSLWQTVNVLTKISLKIINAQVTRDPLSPYLSQRDLI